MFRLLSAAVLLVLASGGDVAAKRSRAAIVYDIGDASRAERHGDVLRHCSELLTLEFDDDEPALCMCATSACLTGDGKLGATYMRRVGKRCRSLGPSTCRFEYDASKKDPRPSSQLIWMFAIVAVVVLGGIALVATRRRKRPVVARVEHEPGAKLETGDDSDAAYEKLLDDELNDGGA